MIMNIKKLFLVLFITIFVFVKLVHATDNLSEALDNANKALANKDYDTAFDEYIRAATGEDNSLAMFTLGLFFQNGWGRPIDKVEACQWFEKAAIGGIPFAAHLYGECLENGVHCDQDYAKAAVWYEKAAEFGYDLSLCYLAELYMEGKGVPENPELAIELCSKSAKNRSIPAQIRLGRLYLEGDEPVRDYKVAFAWFELNALKNNPESIYYLGVMLRDGLGIPKSSEKAVHYFESAAAQGFIDAYFQTGKIYFNSRIDPETKLLPEGFLAKSYLWLLAASKCSTDQEEVDEAKKLLYMVRKMMPETWAPMLKKKVSDHIAKYHHAE